MKEEKKVTGRDKLNEEELSKVSGGGAIYTADGVSIFPLDTGVRATMNGAAANLAGLNVEQAYKSEVRCNLKL